MRTHQPAPLIPGHGRRQSGGENADSSAAINISIKAKGSTKRFHSHPCCRRAWLNYSCGSEREVMKMEASGKPITTNQEVLSWVARMADLCKPQTIHWCDGSDEEKTLLTAEAVERGILIKLN